MWLRRIAFPLFVVMWVLLCLFAPTVSSKTPKNVLVLYPEQQDLPAQRIFDQSLRSSLTARIADRIDFYTEYMEVSRFHGEQHLQLLHEFYRRKYRERQMDLIVAVTRRPLEFLLAYQQEVFSATPVVFCAIDPGPLHSLRVEPRITGFVRHLDFKATMEVALRLHPQTRRVVLMSGTSPTDHYYRAMAWSQLRDYEAQLEFIDLGALPIPEILERVAELPQETVILFGTFFLDSTGRSFIPQEAVSLVAQTANAPLYSVFDTFLGQGMVGGYLYSHEALGVRVAELGARILQGEKPEDLPIRRDDTNAYLFDWRQLRRWGINEASIPPGSVVHYKERSMWEQYQGYVLAGGVLCGIETLLIVTLLVQRRRRRQAEQELAQRLRFETLSADLSTTFVNMGPSDDLEKSILLGLQQVTEFFGADRGSLAEFKEPTDAFHITHSWAVTGCEPLPSGTSSGRFPWCAEQLLGGSMVRCTTLEELPEAAAVDRENFRKAGVKSLLLVPLTAGDAMLGLLGFGALRCERIWTDEVAQYIQVLGEVFANALQRRRTEQALRESEALSRAVLASLEGLVAVVDNDGVIIEVNEAWSRFAHDHHPGPTTTVSIGANYLVVCRRASLTGHPDAMEVLLGLELVLSGTRPEFRCEYRCRTPAGEVWYAMSVEPLRRVEGGAVISHRDITEHKRAELAVQRHHRELAHVARLAMMGELAASLAHELNQPLTAILSNAQAAQRFLRTDPPDLAEVHAILADVVEDDQRAGEVIRRLRHLFRKGEVELLPLNLNEVSQEVVRLLHSDAIIRHVNMGLELDPALPPVRGDRVQLQQVLLNLMLNSFDAMAAQAIDDRQIVVRTQRIDASLIQVAVQDSGSGIDEDELGRIFEPFYTTKAEGMGMGLSICRSILALHGGHLWAANNPQCGVTFYFTLPVGAAEPQ